MNARRVKDAVMLVDAACSRIAELRQRRTASRTPVQLQDDITLLNASIRAANSRYEQGMLLAQKALLFNHDHLLNGLGNLQTMLSTLKRFAKEPLVQHEISRSGHDAYQTRACFEQAQTRIEEYRAIVEQHEQLLAQGLEGMPVSLDELEGNEQRLLAFADWEHKIIGVGKAAAERIKQHPDFASERMTAVASRMAAALVLALASTVA